MTTTLATRRPTIKRAWLVPTGLIVLSAIPVIAGAFRFTELTGGVIPTAQNSRFLEAPIPIVIHIVSATIFSGVGAFQFAPGLRRRRSRWGNWHRLAGRLLIPAGLLSALSGLWMTVFYELPPGDGAALFVLRLIFGTAMVVSIGLGVRAIIRRDFVVHSEWMTRAYAIGVAAGTQPLLLLLSSLFFSLTDELPRAVIMGSAWVINLAVAEYVIRSRAAVRMVTQ
ncbi:MAG: DUF2306 domain-containing protein [Rhodoglobus sp.]